MDFSKKYKKLLFSLFIFLFIFCLLGSPYYNWGFCTDCFGVLYVASKVNSYKDFFNFFVKSIDAGTVSSPFSSDFIAHQPSFLNALYRPFVFVFTFVQWYFLRLSAYLYLLVTVFLHALNAVILFNIFLLFFNYRISFWGTLFFAFHSSLFRDFGLLSRQQYVLSLTFFLLLILTLKKYYLGKSGKGYYLLSNLFFLILIFLQEHFLFLPIWVFISIFFYESIKKDAISLKKRFIKSTSVSVGFFVISVFYLIVRILLFPIFGRSGTLSFNVYIYNLLQNQKERFWDFVTYVVNLLNLNYLPGGHRFLKGTLAILFIILLVYPFFRLKKIKYLLFLVFSIFMFSWAVFVFAYQPRYIYTALPFSIFIFLFSINFYFSKIRKNGKIFIFVLFLFLFVGSLRLFTEQKNKGNFLYITTCAFKDLVNNGLTKNKTIFFIALPRRYFVHSNTQAIWLYRQDSSIPVYYDINNFTEGFCLSLKENFDLNIVPIKNGYRMISINKNKLFFVCLDSTSSQFGQIIVNSKNAEQNVCDISYILSDILLAQNPLFVTWDYKNHKFLILDPPLK